MFQGNVASALSSLKIDPSIQVFEKLLSRFHRGDCLITLATGKLSEDICERAGLVECHAYAVLDLRKLDVCFVSSVCNEYQSTKSQWPGDNYLRCTFLDSFAHVLPCAFFTPFVLILQAYAFVLAI